MERNKRWYWRALIVSSLFIFSHATLAAAPDVVTVPWRGALDLQHDTYDGKQIHLKGVAHNVIVGATASWDPGDGSPVKPVTPNFGFDFDLGVTHTYPASSAGTPYTATLTVCNNGAGPGTECASDTYRVVVRTRTLDVEINIAIDEGLWFLHRRQTRSSSGPADGRWFSTNISATTASAVQAFQINNHFETNSVLDDPYADTVARGLKATFSLLSQVSIAPQTAGNPDTNGNGIGIQAASGSRPIYVGGQVMDAIVSTKTPGAVTTTGPNGAALPAGIAGRSYGDIVQDMVDMYSWGQYDVGAGVAGSAAGGWRYGWNSFPDNSACQWWAIGALAARDLFGATVPAFVTSENLNSWLAYSQTPAPPGNAIGYGYTGRGSGVATSPSGLVQLVMDGIPKTDTARWVSVEQTMANNWNTWYRDTSNYYALFALAKAMRLALPAPTVIMGTGANAIDWFKADCANPAACNFATEKWGVARTIIRDQNANGQLTGSFWTSGDLHHAWGVIILTGTLQLEPVAVATANPNPGATGVPINFDGSGSFHQDPAKSIVSYEWDFNNDNITDATGVNASHPFICPTLPTPCNFPVRLTVTDNTAPTPLVDTATINVSITVPPHPPTSDADGPYLACTGENVSLDGTGSFDINVGLGDSITAYGWELDFAQPLDFNDATGASPSTSYASTGLFDIGLRVTDDSSNIFGSPDLTDDDFTTIIVSDCSCIGAISVRAKSTKLQLTWAPVAGAASYDIRRSTSGPNTGYSVIAVDHVTTYATYLDTGLTNGVTYWYRVTPKDATGTPLCGSSNVASGTPQARTRR